MKIKQEHGYDYTLEFAKKLSQYKTNQLNEIVLPLAKHFFNEREKIRQQYDLANENTFNIFSLFSEKYYLEGFHDEALIAILNPKTPIIGNKMFLEKFLGAIGCKDFGDLDNVKIETQKGRIDILICNEKNAIIIENKLHDAKDQDNQFIRYYDYVIDELELPVLKIVYIPLNKSEPNWLKYDESEKSFSEVKKRLLVLPAVKEEKDDLTRGWLEKINFDEIHYLNDDDKNLAKMFISQYKNLLLGLGADKLMTKSEKDLVKEIYNSDDCKDKIAAIDEFVDFWKNKKKINEALFELICDEMKDEHEKEDNCLFKKLLQNYIYVCFGYDGQYYIGFWKSGFSEDVQTELKDQLDKLNNKKIKFTSETYSDQNWIYRYFNFNGNYSISAMVEIAKSLLKDLEKNITSNKKFMVAVEMALPRQ